MFRRGIMLVGAAVLVGAAGCGSGSPDAAPAPSTAAATTAPPAGASCEVTPPMPNRAAPPYAGHGPHLVAGGMVLGQAVNDSGLYVENFNALQLPDEWQAGGFPSEVDSSKAQLAVCETDMPKRGTRSVGTCTWADGEGVSAIYPATHTFTVYETRTGRAVTTVSVASDVVPADLSCPGSIETLRNHRPPDIAQGITNAKLTAALRPVVTGDAG